jgi:hypothetical protein
MNRGLSYGRLPARKVPQLLAGKDLTINPKLIHDKPERHEKDSCQNSSSQIINRPGDQYLENGSAYEQKADDVCNVFNHFSQLMSLPEHKPKSGCIL